MTDNQKDWLDLYQERIETLRGAYLKGKSIPQKVRILSTLERMILGEGVPPNEIPYELFLGSERFLGEKSNIDERQIIGKTLSRNFPRILESLRKEKKATIEDTALAVGMHPRTYHRIISKETRKPNMAYIKGLALYFDVPLNTFYK